MARLKREKNIWDYLHIVYEHRWIFLIPFCITTLGATIGSFFLPRVYEAETTILFKDTGLMNPLVHGLAYQVDERGWIGTVEEKIKSWPMLKEIIERVGLDKDITPGDREAMEWLARDLRDKIEINVRGYNVAKISYRGGNPQEVQDVVNTTANLFIEKNRFAQGKETGEAIRFLEEQRETYFQRLATSRETLARFQQEHPLELPTDQKANLERLVELEGSLKKNESEIEEINRELRMTRAEIPITGKRLNTSTSSQLKQDVDNLAGSLKKYENQYTEQHPAVTTAKKAITAKQQNLKEEEWQIRFSPDARPGATTIAIEKNVATLEERLASLKEERNNLLNLISEYKTRTKNIPLREQEHTKLQSEVELNAKLCTMISERLENARISNRLEKGSEEGPFEILDPARYPLFPCAPKKKLIAFLGLCVGSIIGFIGCLVMEQVQANSSLKEKEEGDELAIKRRRAA